MQSINLVVESFFAGIRTPLGVNLMYVVTKIFDTLPFFLIILCFIVIIYKKRGALEAILMAFATGIASATAYFLKHITDVSRPSGALIVELDKSFPSGHTTMATVFFIMLMYIFSPRLIGWKKVVFYAVCIFVMLLVPFSRLYLDVHWFSDILGGFALGSLATFVSVKLYKKYDKFVG